MADKTSADCHVGPKAHHVSGTRPESDIHLIVIHDTEGGNAAGVAKYFAYPSSGGSAHLVVDNDECWRCLANTDIPWGAPGANTNGFHIEQCGKAAWTTEQWMANKATILRAAYKTAFHCHKFKIPPTFIDRHGLAAGKKGITTHAEVAAWHPQGNEGHHDPGTNWPRAYFMTAVRRYYKQLERLRSRVCLQERRYV